MRPDTWSILQAQHMATRQARERGIKALFSQMEIRDDRVIFHVLPEDQRLHLIAGHCWCNPDEDSDLVEHVPCPE